MNKENTLKIINDFPDFFKYRDNIRVSLMAFGFSCDDGWFDIIYQLCQDIKDVYDKSDKRFKSSFYIQQVKEKFATLRFYTSCGTDEVFDLIHKAEEKSGKTCEVCGHKGTVHTTNSSGAYGWLKTLCSKCAKDTGKYYPFIDTRDVVEKVQDIEERSAKARIDRL